jgi:hypothetical protein
MLSGSKQLARTTAAAWIRLKQLSMAAATCKHNHTLCTDWLSNAHFHTLIGSAALSIMHQPCYKTALPGLGPLGPWALPRQPLEEVRYLLLELRKGCWEASVSERQHSLPRHKEAVGPQHTGLCVPA